MQANPIVSERTHSYWLIAILAVAAAVRFYGLGQNSISAEGLFNVSFCSVNGWWEMTEKYTGKTGLPFVYPTFLCQFADATAHDDFFVRAFSSVMGVGSIYMVYLLGRRFLSSSTGLLAATLLAVDYQTILIDRSVTPYSFFALICLVHMYSFVCVLLADARKPLPLQINARHLGLRYEVYWLPSCACYAGTLLAFWGSALLAIYTNPVALVVFGAEAILLCFLIESREKNALLKGLWVPVMIGAAPCVWTLLQRLNWAVNNHAFGFFVQNATDFSRVPFFSKIDAGLFYFNAMGAMFSVLAVIVVYAQGAYKKQELKFLGVLLAMAFFMLAALAIVQIVDVRSFLFVWLWSALFLANFLGILIDKIRFPRMKEIALALCVLSIVIVQIKSNARNAIYQRGVDRGFEWAAEIIAGDEESSLGKVAVVVNSKLFNFYLNKYDLISQEALFLKNDVAEKDRKRPVTTSFYYLEYTGVDTDFSSSQAIYDGFAEKYKKVCSANKKRFRVTKFSAVSLPSADPVANCSDYLKIKGSYL